MTNWIATIDIKEGLRLAEGLADEDDAVRVSTGYISSALLAALEDPKLQDEIDQIILRRFANELVDCETEWDVNDVLEDLYDWADYRKVWLGI